MEMEKECCKFPEDIVVEILCRLPRKSLARFKCISKRWHFLISDSNSVISKTTHQGFVCQTFFRPLSPPPPSFGGYEDEMDYPHPRLDFFQVADSKGSAHLIPSSHSTSIDEIGLLLSSCNGFLLFRKKPKEWGEEKYVVYHPATQRSWDVDPTFYMHTMHVGLASDGRHFKLVRIFSVLDETNIATEVYCSKIEDWKKDPFPLAMDCDDVPPFDGNNVETGNSVFANGNLHWIWMKYLLIYYFENECCKTIGLPRVPNNGQRRDRSDHCIWESEGRVFYCRVYCGDKIGIWILHKGKWNSKRYKYSYRWKVKHKGTLANLLSVEIGVPTSFSPVAFIDEFAIVYLMYGTRIFSYNLATKETKEACDSPSAGSANEALCNVFPFLHLTQFDIAEVMVMGGWRAV